MTQLRVCHEKRLVVPSCRNVQRAACFEPFLHRSFIWLGRNGLAHRVPRRFSVAVVAQIIFHADAKDQIVDFRAAAFGVIQQAAIADDVVRYCDVKNAR